MPPASDFRVNPRVLAWARESAGLTLGTAASRTQLSEDQLTSWEAGRRTPSVAQLQSLAAAYKRPLAALLLPQAPDAALLPTDFRLLPTDEREPFSEEVYLAVRNARRLARASMELEPEGRREERRSLGRATLSRNPEGVAEQTRQLLGVTVTEQKGWNDDRSALRRWRNALEAVGILVFQFPLPVEQARGFSVREGGSRAIVMNSRDAVPARIFTLFHELGHLLLDEAGICLLEDEAGRSNAAVVETYCNRFAAEFLVPTAPLRQSNLSKPGPSAGFTDRDLSAIAREYKVSREVILGRLLHLRVIDRKTYEARRSGWGRHVAARARGGRRDPPRDCYRRLGPRFVGTVLNAHHRGILTKSDLADYLGLKLKHLATLERIAAAEAP